MSLLTQRVGVDTKIEFYVRQNWIYSTILIANMMTDESIRLMPLEHRSIYLYTGILFWEQVLISFTDSSRYNDRRKTEIDMMIIIA